MTSPSGPILQRQPGTTKIIACEVLRRELSALTAAAPTELSFLPMELHLQPQKLHAELQRQVDAAAGCARLILAFGLCGGAATGLRAGRCPLLLPRVHDCRPLLLGSRQKLAQLQGEEKGTFYLSDGWLRTEHNILAEHRRQCEKYGERKAARLLAHLYDSYARVLFIHTGTAQAAQSLALSRRIAALLQLEHQETAGSPAYLEKILNGPWDEADFVHVAPGEAVAAEDFGPGTWPSQSTLFPTLDKTSGRMVNLSSIE